MKQLRTGRVGVAVAVSAAALLLLTACGGSSADESSAAASSAPAASAPAASEAPASEAPAATGEFVEFRAAEPGSGDGLKLGLISLDDSIAFSKSVTDGMRAQAEAAGAELVVCDSKLDAAAALACVKNFVAQGVQGYLNFQPISDAGQEICDAGPQDVPVIAIDIAQGDCQTSFMGANNQRAGEIGGQGLGQWAKDNWDCQIDAWVSLEDFGVGSVNDARMGGQLKGFEEVCGPVDPSIIRKLDAGRADTALKGFTDTLTALPDAKRIAVVAINDDGINSALAAARTAGREDQVAASGMGVDKLSHCEIASGKKWIGSVAFFPEKYGEVGIPYLIDAVKGQQIPTELFVNHTYVTADNIADYYDVSGC